MKQMVESIQHFACGYCVNRMDYIFKGMAGQKRVFDAGVFLIKHKKQGYVLYDTGYSYRLMDNRWKYLLYRKANPTYILPQQEIAAQLKDCGVSPEEIRWVILSHLHPDHIGGAKDFPHATFILTPDLVRQRGRFGWKDLVFAEFLPKDFWQRVRVAKPLKTHAAFPYLPSCDLFGDGSMLLSSMDGHATGQGCLYLPERGVFLAADVCWGVDLIPYTDKMKPLAYRIQKDGKVYRRNVERLKTMMADGKKVIVSHDQRAYIKSILQGAMICSEKRKRK